MVQVSIRAMAAEALEDELTVDHRLPRTLRALFLRPGLLTLEYVNGRIVRYIRPFRLYLVSSVIFFLLLSFTSLRFVREAGLDPGAPAGPPSSAAPAAPTAPAGPTTTSDAPGPVDRADTPPLPAAALDSALAEVRAALEQDGLAPADRDSLRAVRNQLIREQARLQRLEARAAEPDAGPADPGVPFAQPEDPTAPPPQPGDPMAFLDDVNLRLGHPRLNAAAAAKLRELRRMEPRQAIERLVGDFIGFIPTIMFLLLPLFAGVLKLLYIRRRRFYAEHFIFLLHTHSFIYLLFTALLLAVVLGWAGGPLMTGMVGWMLIYTYLGMRRVYGQGRAKTFLKLWILGWVYFWVLTITVPIAFLAAIVLA
jgi:hypothetical protein